MVLYLPAINQYIFSSGDNYILKYYGDPQKLENYTILTTEPFIVLSGEISYMLTSNERADIPNEHEYVLLTSKNPTKKNIEDGTLKVKRWLKHPLFETLTPQNVTASWNGVFRFVKEDRANNIEGLRPPQLGAIHAIMSHIQHIVDRAIVVMPTGTGKTEVMLCALVAIPCSKLLVIVPSDALRSQLAEKFLKLGLLKRFGIIPPEAYTPIVGVMGNRIHNRDDLDTFFDRCNVIVTTMPLITKYSDEFKALITTRITHLFVDEAHHSEADTWNAFISVVHYSKVFLFTATPFRTDEKRLQGKFIFNFSLKAAQEQQYYKRIRYLPVREYDPAKSDIKIAERAVQQLYEDRENHFPHILMARCVNKKRALEIAEIYHAFENFKTVVVYTNIPNLVQKTRDIKEKKYDIIVCVDMLGEGFDLPELKIAAIHDERQSIPITLQFVGRFTRTSFNTLGEASFIANIAYPPIRNELDRLYSHDADWNYLLPNMSAQATEKQINFKEFLDRFAGLNSSVIPFQQIRPAMSTTIYQNGDNTWNPGNWRDGIPGLEQYDHQYSNTNAHDNTHVIILGKVNKVDWGDFDTVLNMNWDMVVVFWDLRPNINRVFINFSMDSFNPGKLVKAIFGDVNERITGMSVFRIFHDVKRLAVYNFGARPGSGIDISFRSFFGRGVQGGINLVEQGTLIKNNIFGAGYKDGEKVTLGCSVKGKIWSYERGNLQELITWCRMVGDVITNEDIDPNTVLHNTLSTVIITERPPVVPIAVDWHSSMYARAEEGFEITVNGIIYDLSNSELNVVETSLESQLRFSLDTENSSSVYELTIGERIVEEKATPYFTISQVNGPQTTISYGSKESMNLTDFFMEFGPIIWFANGAQLMQNQYVPLKEHPGRIPLDNIIIDTWQGVNLRKESQGIAPYERDSIQYYFIANIIDDYEIVYDDDASGEIADIIGINSERTYIDIHLYHLKFAIRGEIGNNIDNFYQVCGQAQKSLNWKYRKGREFFNHLLRRIDKTKNGQTCSRLVKGTVEDLEKLLIAAKWEKELRFHIYIAQPSLQKENASDDILLLLGATYHYLDTVGNVSLKVYTS